MPWSFSVSFSCNSMPNSGCSAFHGVNPNYKKLHIITAAPKLVKKVNVFDTDCMPVLVLKNCEPWLLYWIVGRSHLWSLYLWILGKVLWWQTTTLLVSPLWLVKSLKNYLILGLLMTLINVAFLWFPVWFQVFSVNFRSSASWIW